MRYYIFLFYFFCVQSLKPCVHSYNLSQFMPTVFQVLAAEHGIGKLLTIIGFHSIEIDNISSAWIFFPEK